MSRLLAVLAVTVLVAVLALWAAAQYLVSADADAGAKAARVSAFQPGNGSRCACAPVLDPVCDDDLSWPNECSAKCDGVLDATPCLAVTRRL